MSVLITNQQEKQKLDIEYIHETAQKILDALEYPESELSILITDDLHIAELNQEYLNRKGPTNVIAFPMYDDPADFQAPAWESDSGEPPHLLGDVVVSVETAQKEGQEMGITMMERFTQLLIHGILHLMGYDHEKTEEDAVNMETKTDELWKKVGGEV